MLIYKYNDFDMFDECYLSTDDFEMLLFLENPYFRNIWNNVS